MNHRCVNATALFDLMRVLLACPPLTSKSKNRKRIYPTSAQHRVVRTKTKRVTNNRQKRNKKTPMSSALAVFSGSMSVARNPARERNVTRRRMFMNRVSTETISATVLSQQTSPYKLGSQYCSEHITITPSDLTPEAQEWIQQYDRYRIVKAELFVTSFVAARSNVEPATLPITHYAFCDADSSTSQTGGATPWYDITSRDNISKVTLRANSPTAKIAEWNPRPLYTPVSGSSPANVVPSPNTWMDSLILSQEFNGVRTYAACPVESANQGQYRFHLQYDFRVLVEAQGPL